MPEIEREFELDVPPEAAWAYLTDMENFAQHVPGFQEFEKIDETTSHWTIRVDLSKFARVMTFEVTVTEEEFPHGAFELDPLNQPASGDGSVTLEPDGEDTTVVTFTLASEASGRMAPFLNQVIKKALPHISDNLIEDLQTSEIEVAPQ